MKILVTGAAGFIGMHLIQRLVKDKVKVIGIDNLNDYYDVSLKKDRLRNNGIDLLQNEIGNLALESTKYPNFKFYSADITNRIIIEKIFADERFDIVVNLAAQAGVRYSITNPESYVNVNITGFFNILDCCRINNIREFIYASSSSVYGNEHTVPFNINANTDSPVSLYAATKKANELIAHAYSNIYKLKTIGLRFFTVYGAYGRPDMAYYSFTKDILSGNKIKVFNEGNLLRDFTFIDDVIQGIMLIIKNPSKVIYSSSNPYYKLYNIGNSKPVNILTFIEIIEKELGKKANKEFLPMQAGDVEITYADVSDLQNELNYRPNTPLEYGIKKFVEWYKEYYFHHS
jgi:UDP-glucuronate 4-epimerase